MATISTAPNGQRMTDADFMELRKTTIAAHEAPALFESVAEIAETSEDHEEFETQEGVSISAYASPLALWEMKSGLYTPTGSGRRGLWSRIKWGVIDAACEEEGIAVRRPEGAYIHAELDMMSARPDKEGSDDEGTTWCPIVSYNVAGTMADTWRNAVGEWVAPEYVQIEAQHHMAVTGAERTFVVALFGGVTTRFFTVERDEDLVTDIVETIRDFWNLVETGQRPGDRGERDAKVMSRLNSKVLPEMEVVDKRDDPSFLALVEQKDALSKKAGKLKKEIDAIKAEIAARMNGIGSAVISDTQQISWITVAEKHVEAQVKPGYSYLRARKISEKSAGPKLMEIVGS